MKKALTSSLLTIEIAAFVMLLLLFFMNTNKPYLLLVPIVGTIGGYFLLKALAPKLRSVKLMVVLSVLLSVLIAASVIIFIRVI
jgi:NAD(P)H-dependent FMN reductase